MHGSTRLAALRSCFEGDGPLFTHGGDDGDKEIFTVIEVALDLLANVALRDTNVVLGGTILGHQVQETIIDVDLSARLVTGLRRDLYQTYKLVFGTEDVGDIHVVGGRANIFLCTITRLCEDYALHRD